MTGSARVPPVKGDATHQAERRARRRLLAAIHAEATRVNLDEAARRDLQEHLTGQRSCRAMSLAELRRVADAIRRGTGRPGPRDVSRPVDNLAGMRRRALALAASFGAGAAYLDAIARRQAAVAFADATAEQLRGVIAAVYRQAQRRGTEPARETVS